MDPQFWCWSDTYSVASEGLISEVEKKRRISNVQRSLEPDEFQDSNLTLQNLFLYRTFYMIFIVFHRRMKSKMEPRDY